MNETTELITPDLNTMKRADLPVIWGDFREKFAALQTTAETISVTDELDIAGMKIARTTRLAIKEIRVAVEAKRKELGEEALRRKQGIDSDAKAIRELCESLETRLESSEKFAERAAAARAAQRFSDRTAAVITANGEPSSYNLASCSDEAFTNIIAALEVAEQLRVAAAEKAEADRLAAIAAAEAEKERIRLENIRLAEDLEAAKAKAFAERKASEAEAARLRAEADAREAAAAQAAAAALAKVQAEAEAARKKQAAIDAEKFRLAREAADRENARLADERRAEREKAAAEAAEAAKAKAEADAENARLAGIAEAQRQIAAKAQAEVDRAAAAAAARAADEKRAAAKAAAAPDAEKLLQFVASIRALVRPDLSKMEPRRMLDIACFELEQVADNLSESAKTL